MNDKHIAEIVLTPDDTGKLLFCPLCGKKAEKVVKAWYGKD